MPYSACRLLLVLLAGLLALATAQNDPIKNFCRRHGHQTCVIDSKLYIDGGFVYYGTSVTPNSQPESNKRLLWADLNDLGLGVPAQHSNLTKSLEVPSVHGGVLWPDTVNKHFYLFGGIFNEGKVEAFHNLWSFDTVYNNWTEITPDGSQLDILWPSLGASDVTDEGVAYYYGGYAGNDSVAGWAGDTIMLNGLVQYDMNKNTWDNRSYDSTPRAEGNMHYIPASQRGMLVYFGGLEQKTAGNTSYASMSDIHVFDIANSRWFTQTADGEMPQARRGFCSGVAWAEDYSSYNFYIYGGISPNETALGDLWILSLPSFKWIPWYPTVKQEYFPGGKAWSSCNVMQNSKMIVMGGKVVNPERDACDAPTAWGQHGVLLGQESVEKETMWYGLGVDAPKYRVPGNITEVIGGGTEGKATVTAPAGGWQTSDLRVYFQTSYPATLRSATRALPSSSTTSSSIPAPSSSSTNTGAIAGGVVGGVLGLAGILALAWFCLRRRRKQKANDPPPATAMQAPPQHNGAEKFVATSTTTSYPSTFPSPHPNASGYSPQASPPPPSWSEHHSPSTYYHESPPMPQHTWGSHDMPIQYANQQPYYSPPSDPSQSVKHSHTASVELPPNEVLEMPEVRSPMPEVRSPAPKRGF
ncbi:hypothetical protein C7974DRAFT_53559 [Boeremia exigua]|uniref:uncharacterized protein n=1 Tax=Boeremia exigua TaxID=749465 RepID=UPI001E8DE609|nr:uncharacterized protein C7974DRAFT_53559 [Boeremia exigua]KAH6616877.1 hypothetical protein C7974DRAFT_53559 [Boeremia exigua]